jgi:hypothetical protein
MNLHFYDRVRTARPMGARDQALALGASPWAAGKYIATGSTEPGSALVDIIDANELTAYDGAEKTLNPQPQPILEEDDDMQPFVAEVTGGEAQFIVWPDGTRTWIAEGADLPQLYKKFGQDGPVQLSSGTLGQIPAKVLPPAPAPAPSAS